MSKRLSLFIFVLVTCGLLLVVLSAGAQSSPSSKPNPDPAALSGMNLAPGVNPARNTKKIAAVPSWTRIAYQKLGDNDNWDIYIYDGSGEKRLTNDAAEDLQPGLNRGGSKVAFSSGRDHADGQLDLYTINVDQTGLKHLYSGWTAFPEWSPDSSKIAFQAWVVDNYEIFVIDADGSNLQRLTNNPDFDGQPTWSPDGTMLAFSSRRNGQYAIYTMNSNGSSLKKLTTYPLSLHPTWSPDGQYIGFDADTDGDFWQELAVVKSDGSGQKTIYNPGTSATAWAGSWSPDAGTLGFTEITLINQNGQWLWTKGTLNQWDMGSNLFSNLIPGDTNWYMDWQTLDLIPPVTSIKPVNAYSDADKFYLSWSGIDLGGSGLKSYSVYYRSPTSNGWKTYWSNTVATAAQFQGTPGEKVEFLVRAQDNALNQGLWWQQPTVSTTFYNTKISGHVLDNRGTLLSHTPITINPSPMSPVVTNDQGQYLGYTTKPGIYGLLVNHPNYQPFPLTNTINGEDFQRTLTLLPKDNVVTNGNFEASSFVPTGWTTAGGLPIAVTALDQASGKNSVQARVAGPNALSTANAVVQGTISQEVTIQPGLQAPTLAFMAKALGDNQGDGSGLEVLVKPDGGSAVSLINRKINDFWTLYWVSMVPYQGQKVDLIFQVTQSSDDPPLTVYLDDISLGSAHPDLWTNVQAVPRSAIPGEIVSFEIEYGNRGNISAQNGRTTLTLDQNLTFVAADPPAIQAGQILQWNWPSLSGHQTDTITVWAEITGTTPGKTAAQAWLTSETEEANIVNNVHKVTLGSGNEVFFPIAINFRKD